MERNLASHSVLRCSAYALAMTVAGVGSMSPGSGAHAQETNHARALSDLERAFWICDYTATTRRVDMATALACGSINADLKDRKFGGDYDALLAWWRLNKEAMHRTVDLAARSARTGNATVDRARAH